MKKLLTPKVRKAIYAATAAVVPLLTVLGLINEGQGQLIIEFVAAALTFFTSVLAATHTKTSTTDQP